MTVTTDAPRLARNAVATLFPGYFALVMATGIIAIGASQQDLDWLAESLFAIAVVAYVVLAGAARRRASSATRGCSLADLTSHAKGFAFLTVVAATNVLGSAAGVIHGWWGLAWALWYASLAAVGGARLHHAHRRRPAQPQAGARRRHQRHLVPAHRLDRIDRRARRAAARPRTAATRWRSSASPRSRLGLVLYLIVMTMVFLRWTFQALEPTEADPPAWIAAGAVAITVLAGSNLLLARDAVAAHRAGRPVRRGRRRAGVGDRHVLVPADGRHRRLAPHRPPGAAALPPVVLGDGLPARHVRRRHLPDATATELDAFGWLPQVVLAIALAAWALAFTGLVTTTPRSLAWASGPAISEAASRQAPRLILVRCAATTYLPRRAHAHGRAFQGRLGWRRRRR